MHKKCVEFVVEYCKDFCPNWSKCIAESKGFDKAEDAKDLLACLIMSELNTDDEEIYGKELERKWDLIKTQYITQ